MLLIKDKTGNAGKAMSINEWIYAILATIHIKRTKEVKVKLKLILLSKYMPIQTAGFDQPS